MSDLTIKTPQTHPDHQTVGQHFVANCVFCTAGWHVYYCDSYDPRLGFWMTRADCPPEHLRDRDGEWRCHVSERAIGRTVHRILVFDGGFATSTWGPVDPALLLIPGQGVAA